MNTTIPTEPAALAPLPPEAADTAPQSPAPPFGPKTLLLDLGTHAGWAILDGGSIVCSGTILLATEDELEIQRREGKDRLLDCRFVRLRRFIREHVKNGVHRVVFEDVGFGGPRMHAQLWPTLRTAILAEADPNPDLRLDCVPVGTLKHYATGNVSAKKLDMARALARIFHRRLQNWFFSEGNS